MVRANFDDLKDFISLDYNIVLLILNLQQQISEIKYLRPFKLVKTVTNDNTNAP